MVSDMDEMDLDSEDKAKSDPVNSSSMLSSYNHTTNNESGAHLKSSLNRIIDVQQEKDHIDEQDPSQ